MTREERRRLTPLPRRTTLLFLAHAVLRSALMQDHGCCMADRVAQGVAAFPFKAVVGGHEKLSGGGHELPAGGENCPLTVMGSARHDVVCLAAVRG